MPVTVDHLLTGIPEDGLVSVVVPEGQIVRVSFYDSGDDLMGSTVCAPGLRDLMYPGAVYAVVAQEPCDHDRAVPVEAGGEEVARLCLTCDAQLPASLEGAVL